MTRSIISRLSIAVLALGAASACSSQSSADYQGEPLFRLKGTVTVPKEFEGEDLVPVLMFPLQDPPPAEGGYLMEILDVGVTGSFPSNFVIDVYDPPPESALHFDEALPRFAVGYVSAMAPSHPSLIEYTTGDPALQFAGYSLNIVVTYAPEPIAADSALTFLWGTGEAIPAGYQLRRMVVRPEQSWPEVQACVNQAWIQALDDYNAIHGTKHLDPSSMEVPWDFFALHQARRRDGGCPQPEGFPLVEDPANTPVSIDLGAEGPLNTRSL